MNILDKALEIVIQEVDKLHIKSKSEALLDRAEASALTDYIKTLVMIRKDDREAFKSDPMSNKTDDELKDLAKQALEYLKSQEEPNEQPTTPSELQIAKPE